jgi:hypothetical protein
MSWAELLRQSPNWGIERFTTLLSCSLCLQKLKMPPSSYFDGLLICGQPFADDVLNDLGDGFAVNAFEASKFEHLERRKGDRRAAGRFSIELVSRRT